MGKHFGNLQKLTGVTYYSLSPNELRPFGGLFNPGLQHFVRRYAKHILPITIPMTTMYVVAQIVVDKHKETLRKNPDDFKDDV